MDEFSGSISRYAPNSSWSVVSTNTVYYSHTSVSRHGPAIAATRLRASYPRSRRRHHDVHLRRPYASRRSPRLSARRIKDHSVHPRSIPDLHRLSRNRPPRFWRPALHPRRVPRISPIIGHVIVGLIVLVQPSLGLWQHLLFRRKGRKTLLGKYQHRPDNHRHSGSKTLLIIRQELPAHFVLVTCYA
jgi:hypothetical protein